MVAIADTEPLHICIITRHRDAHASVTQVLLRDRGVRCSIVEVDHFNTGGIVRWDPIGADQTSSLLDIEGNLREIRDSGNAFDLSTVPEPDLDSLPEGGMGLHIARAMLDEVAYEPGPPNLWRLVKRHAASSAA